MRFFLLRSKSFGLLRKLKPTQNAFCNEVKQKKKRQTCTHTRHISHTHTNTPFRYLLWSELSHLRKKKRTEVRAGSLKTKQQQQPDTMIHCRVRGQILERHMGSAAMPFLSHMLHFSFEVGKLRFRECARCETGCVTFFFFFFILEDVMKHYTLPAAVTPSKTLWNVHSFFAPTCVQHEKALLASFTDSFSRAASICFIERFNLDFFFVSLLAFTIPPYLIFSLFIQLSVSMFDWAETR